MKLFVAGISGNWDDDDLKEMFELYGEVKFAQIIKDRATGKSKGFGFVEMPNAVEAKETMELLDGAGMYGKKIAVKEAEEQPRNNPGGGGFGGPPRNNTGGGGYGNNSRNNSSGGGYGNNNNSGGGYKKRY